VAGGAAACDGPAVPAWKRVLDIALVLLVSPVVLPIFAIFAIYIKLVSRGPVFFVQERVGFHGNVFQCLKFRTMHSDTGSGVHQNHLADLMNSKKPMKKLDAIGDKRIIPYGFLLRSSGLDELPQLINVLRGEMSVIGPRPCTQYEYDLYESWQKRRFLALPGLTGLWQVSGKNKTTFDEMIRLDIRYAENQSLGQDVRILAKTMPVLWGQVREHLTARRQQKAAGRPWNGKEAHSQAV
jgi:lipopolysaccharide/colanic/teichoic acid biosynthesis glycosyltransferase